MRMGACGADDDAPPGETFKILRFAVSVHTFVEAAEQETVVWQEFSFVELGLAQDVDVLEPEGKLLREIIRAGGKLSRPKNGGSFDLVALRLAKWLREHSAIDDEPLQYTEAMNAWITTFECATKRPA